MGFIKRNLDIFRINFKKFYDKPIATVKSTTVSDPEIKNAVRIARI